MQKSKLTYLLVLFVTFVLFTVTGCEKKEIGSVEKMHWDRDMCERCKMAISERKYAVQAINPANGKVYKFDDIGCLVLWFKENNIKWQDDAIIWITDANTGKWINARTAKYSDESITPMAYGFAAYTDITFPKDLKAYDLNYTKDKIIKIEQLNNQKVKTY